MVSNQELMEEQDWLKELEDICDRCAMSPENNGKECSKCVFDQWLNDYYKSRGGRNK